MHIHRDGIDRFFERDFHVETRTVYIGGEVDSVMASAAIKGIHILKAMNTDAITILLNTEGGCIMNGLAIYDAIQQCGCHATIEVIGQAQSMGACILQAADDRAIHQNAIIMLHDGHMGLEDNFRSCENWAEWSKKRRRDFYKLLASKTGKTFRHWEKVCASDYILSAEEALKEGLVDRIITGEES